VAAERPLMVDCATTNFITTQIGNVCVRPHLPDSAAYALPGGQVEHGHVLCYDLIAGPPCNAQHSSTMRVKSSQLLQHLWPRPTQKLRDRTFMCGGRGWNGRS
jgi:hypothetical protein